MSLVQLVYTIDLENLVILVKLVNLALMLT